jgi:hypothetical protein
VRPESASEDALEQAFDLGFDGAKHAHWWFPTRR